MTGKAFRFFHLAQFESGLWFFRPLLHRILLCLKVFCISFVRQRCSLILNAPVIAYGHSVALVATSWRGYGAPGRKHGAAGDTQQRGQQQNLEHWEPHDMARRGEEHLSAPLK